MRKIKRKRKTVGGVYSDKMKEKKKYRDRQRAEHMPRKRKQGQHAKYEVSTSIFTLSICLIPACRS